LGSAGDRRAAARVVSGQYLGFAAILAASIAGALGVGLLPEPAVPYLGLLPLLLGIRAAWRTRKRETPDPSTGGAVGALAVAATTLANGSDNIGVYVPVFATAGAGALVTFAVVFQVLLAVWCGVGRWLATRQLIARVLARWGHVVLPAVLIGLGVVIMVEGGAFGL